MPLPRFAKLPAERRDAILDAALAEFAEQGYAQASFNRIIERVGISKGAIYYYFSDKEDLYLTVLERAWTELTGAITLPRRVADAEAFWGAVAAAYRALLGVVRRDPRIVHLAQGSVAELAQLRDAERLAPLLAGVGATVETLLSLGQRVRAVRKDLPRELLVPLVLAVGEVLDRYMLEHRELERERDSERAIARGVEIFRRLLGP